MDRSSFGLDNGSSYTGKQTTGNGSFRIDMKVNSFNIKQGYLCGTFTIYNLTSEHSVLKTYFEGRLVGPNDMSNTTQDKKCWARFPTWKKDIQNKSLVYDPFNSKYLYLRIKELFLLPNPKIRKVSGASIDGYYYCCYYKRSDTFGGFYQVDGHCRHGVQQILMFRTDEKKSQSYQWA